MNIKTKLLFSFGFLLALILVLLIISTANIAWVTNDTKNILENNQKSLLYVEQMLLALDKEQWQKFEDNLALQKKNITEVGENQTTIELELAYQNFRKTPANSQQQAIVIREILMQVMQLNLQAIVRKGKLATDTGKQAAFWILFSSTICLLVAFIMLFNLPEHIASPIKALSNSLTQIAARNYSLRLQFERSDEFAELGHAFNKMAAKLEEYQNSNLAQILLEKRRIEALIDNIEDPIIGFDENRRIIFANHEALGVLGLNPADVIGFQADEVALHNDLMRLLAKNLMENPSSSSIEEPLKIYQEGKENYFEKNIVSIYNHPTENEEPSLIGHLFMLQNITSFKELDLAKTNFIANVSHELKTPIAAIQMGVKLLKDNKIGALNEEQYQLIEHIDEDCKRLLAITTELLGISQVEAGKISLNLANIHPIKLIHYAVQANQTSATEKNIELFMDVEKNLPSFQTDPEKTAWILTNLISNSIRYSPENAKIIIRCFKYDQGISFEVQDFGKGIDKQYKDKIFDRYFRVPGTNTQGSGLGLAISKEFIEALGGHIEVDSELGSGAVFKFNLPSMH